MRFLLVDRILELESGKRAVGLKNVTLSEDFLAYHFPEYPIMPGVLITEALVQLASWIISESTDFEQMGIAVEYERLKFRRLVRPGDQLRMEVEIVNHDPTRAEVKGKAFCDGQLVATAQFALEVHPTARFQDPAEARQLYALIRG